MHYQIGCSKGFFKSLENLDPQAQLMAKATVTDFMNNPEAGGFNFESIHAAQDKNLYSIRVNSDIRLIVHRKDNRLQVLHANHHDKAYEWAARYELSVHPVTGAAQLVEIAERVREVTKTIVLREYKEEPLFSGYADDYLLSLGVPERWLDFVRTTGRSGLYDLIGHLPDEAIERLLLLADGKPVPRPEPQGDIDPFEHPDAKRRFQVATNEAELARALEYPWEQWMVFLHPMQRELVDRSYSGPARVSGSAGTGKTVVALHRVANLRERNPDARILLTTFSKALASRLEHKLGLLVGTQELRHVTVANLHRIAYQYWVEKLGNGFQRAPDAQVDQLIKLAARSVPGLTFSPAFLKAEWDTIVDAMGLNTWDDYRSVSRVGRGTPLGARQRQPIWEVFKRVKTHMQGRGLMTFNQLCHLVADHLEASDDKPFDYLVVDESQDLGPAELRLCRALVKEGPNDLFFCGDMGQRIYKGKFPWSTFGVDIRGRSACLRVNYRTTEQICAFASSMLPRELIDIDGEAEERTAVSLLSGPEPQVLAFKSVDDEIEGVAETLQALTQRGYAASDIAIFARTTKLLEGRAEAALSLLTLPYEYLKNDKPATTDYVSLGTMHAAKGLEFRAVIVMACEEKELPASYALNGTVDEAGRAEALEMERQLLYVAATRAREELLITHAGPPSPFLATTRAS